MEEKYMIPMEKIKERKVEILKDINTATDSEKEIAERKEQEKKERKFLIQLIVVFCTWVFLIILLMRNEKIEPKKISTPPKPSNPSSKNAQQKANIPKTPTSSSKTPNQETKPPDANKENQPGKQPSSQTQPQHQTQQNPQEQAKEPDKNRKNYL